MFLKRVLSNQKIMSIKRRLFNFIADVAIKVLNLNKANIISCGFLGKIEPVFIIQRNGIKYFISCPNRLTRWRAETYFTKEPETIEWIDTFKEGDTLFDVGANIGLYSIYASKKGINVIAFEPESQNFALLNKNIYLNKCHDKVISLNVALSDNDSFDYLYLPLFQTGGAINCLGSPLDEQGKPFSPVFKQGVVSYTLDSFLCQCKIFPTHIKIDVDGIEPKIINGSEKTLKDLRLKSISIELNDELLEHTEVINKIQSKGLMLRHKRHAEMFEGGKYSKIFNYVFERP